jgi:PhnB protein
MARVGTYLNFERSTEAALRFYAEVFRTEISAPILRFRDLPPAPGMPPVDPEIADLVMHAEVPILGGHILMGTDVPGGTGFTLVHGNTVHLTLDPETRAEADRLFAGLADGGTVTQPLQPMFWGGYFGTLIDRFGVHWMVNCTAPA